MVGSGVPRQSPNGVSLAVAGALGLAGAAALGGVEAIAAGRGEVVLVVGATGGSALRPQGVDAVLPLAADGVVLAGTCHPNGRLAAALA